MTINLDDIWKNISEINRAKIEEAKKYNLTLDYPSEDVTTFFKLLLKHHQRKGIPCVSKKWIERLLAYRGEYSVALLKHENTVVSGTMVKDFKKAISFPFTCILKEGNLSKAYAYSLYWNLIKYFAEKGHEIFHSGRIPRNDLTDEYRLGWGGTKFDYYYQYYPNYIANTEYSIKRGWKRNFLTSCWKSTPMVLTKLLGPLVVKKYP